MKSESLSPRKRSFLYVKDILESCRLIGETMSSLTKEEFDKNRIVRDSLTWNIYVIGEAVRNLPDEIREMAPEVPWKIINGVRNKLAHQYFGIKYSIIWRTALVEIPILETSISQIYESLKLEFGDSPFDERTEYC